ncbi:LysR family transcriptional regulator [Mycolicibacterium goodii]|uniref:LysR family transcriptional regulator n=1 Tax=Mycolicibacterium goodii TaxID=134601 RepID=A0ABS6HUP0_MYCGD|nr:LysR family transcriptional regulator [Mycolicibacterium goodii]MBU8825067.1 LysR family transcriptional regulator [Mycolicibacterium goodii]MBU8838463.1 LysR family transcriptional regulator [Mycolicibacterium goodii]
MRIEATLAQLQCVVAVSDARSFSKAARLLMLAQSSLSRTVAQVERMYGVKLFERTTRALELTDEGEQFVQMAQRILHTYQQETEDFEGYLAGTKGVLRLAALPSLAVSLLPPMITRFRDRYPDILVEVEDVLAGQITDYVRSGVVDLAVTAAPTPSLQAVMTSAGIRFEAIAVDHFYCVLPHGHRLLDQPTIDWSDLAGEAFIAFEESSSVRVIVDEVLLAHGVVPARLVSARNVASIAGMCAAGLGVSAAPGFVLPLMAIPGVVTRPIGTIPVARRIGVLRSTRRSPSPPARQFLEIINSASEVIALPDGAYWTKAV